MPGPLARDMAARQALDTADRQALIIELQQRFSQNRDNNTIATTSTTTAAGGGHDSVAQLVTAHISEGSQFASRDQSSGHPDTLANILTRLPDDLHHDPDTDATCEGDISFDNDSDYLPSDSDSASDSDSDGGVTDLERDIVETERAEQLIARQLTAKRSRRTFPIRNRNGKRFRPTSSPGTAGAEGPRYLSPLTIQSVTRVSRPPAYLQHHLRGALHSSETSGEQAPSDANTQTFAAPAPASAARSSSGQAFMSSTIRDSFRKRKLQESSPRCGELTTSPTPHQRSDSSGHIDAAHLSHPCDKQEAIYTLHCKRTCRRPTRGQASSVSSSNKR